jgi:hypothetical protein
MTWAEDKAMLGSNLSADPGVANESGRLSMPPDSFPLICNTNAKNPTVKPTFRITNSKNGLPFQAEPKQAFLTRLKTVAGCFVSCSGFPWF